jgi:hypothetical protein
MTVIGTQSDIVIPYPDNTCLGPVLGQFDLPPYIAHIPKAKNGHLGRCQEVIDLNGNCQALRFVVSERRTTSLLLYWHVPTGAYPCWGMPVMIKQRNAECYSVYAAARQYINLFSAIRMENSCHRVKDNTCIQQSRTWSQKVGTIIVSRIQLHYVRV